MDKSAEPEGTDSFSLFLMTGSTEIGTDSLRLTLVDPKFCRFGLAGKHCMHGIAGCVVSGESSSSEDSSILATL